MKPTILPITFDYIAIEFLLNKDEGSIEELHPYLGKRISLKNEKGEKVDVDPKLVKISLDSLAEQGLIEIRENSYIALQDKRETLKKLYDKWGEEWKNLVEKN